MRSTVTSSDLLIFFPAVVYFVQTFYWKLNSIAQVKMVSSFLKKQIKHFLSFVFLVVNYFFNFNATFINSC